MSTLNKLSKIIKILSLLVIIYYLIEIPNSKSYEVSLYNQFPIFFWISIAISVIIAQYELINKQNTIINILTIILYESVLLFLPFLRGYFMWGRGDSLSHVGMIKDIIYTGHISEDNFYPIMHILIAELGVIQNISIEKYTLFIFLPFSLFFGICCYILLREVLPETSGWAHFVFFIPLFGYWNTAMVPNMFSFFMIPSILYLINKRFSPNEKSILLIILLITMVYFHPLTILYMFFIILLSRISNLLAFNKQDNDISILRYGIIILVSWLIWYLNFLEITRPLKKLLMMTYPNVFFIKNINSIHEYRFDFFDIFKLVYFRYGLAEVLSFAILINSIFYTLVNRKTKNFKLPPNTLAVLIFCTTGLVFFGGLLSISSRISFVNYERIVKYIIFLLLLLYIVSLNLLRRRNDTNLKNKILISLSLIMITITSILTLYSYPLNGKINDQVLVSEYSGMKWFFEHRNEEFKMREQQISLSRFYELIYTHSKIHNAKNLKELGEYPVLPHYGYNIYNSICQLYKENTYLVISDAMKSYYEFVLAFSVPKSLWKWTPEEIKKILQDSGVSKIYSNNGLMIFLIKA